MKTKMRKFGAWLMAAALAFAGAGAYADAGVPEGATKVAEGFYQSAATYEESTDFYITSVDGLRYFRDFVNGVNDYYLGAGGKSKVDYTSVYVFSGKTVNLCTDIDLGSENFTAIGYDTAGGRHYFYGSFNGHGHKISNFSYVWDGAHPKASGSNAFAGFFAYVNANAPMSISNLTFENPIVGGYGRVGTLIGSMSAQPGQSVIISNCHVVGTINLYNGIDDAEYTKNKGRFIGGLIGHVGDGSAVRIVDCSVEGSSSSVIRASANTVGGITGYTGASGVAIENCLVSGVTLLAESGSGIGGISSSLAGSGQKNVIRNCTVSNVVGTAATATSCYGIIAGMIETEGATIEDCESFDVTFTQRDNPIAVQCADTKAIVGREIVRESDGKLSAGVYEHIPGIPGDNRWIAEGYEAVALGTTPETWEVCPLPLVAQIGEKTYTSLEEAFAAVKVHETVKLLCDLDFSDRLWTPVDLVGSFDGQNHTVSNLKIDLPGQDNVGFFSRFRDQEGAKKRICNFTLVNVDVKGRANVAALVGGNSEGTVSNVTIRGSIKVDGATSGISRAYTGVVVGGWGYMKFIDVTVDGLDKSESHVRGGGTDGRYVGGLVGHADDVTLFENCTVRNLRVEGDWLSGGMCGPGPANGVCRNCTVENVDIAGNYSGGVFGWFFDASGARDGTGVMDGIVVRNVTFERPYLCGTVGGYGMDDNVVVKNLTVEGVDERNLIHYVAFVTVGPDSFFYSTVQLALDNSETLEAITVTDPTATIPSDYRLIEKGDLWGLEPVPFVAQINDGKKYMTLGEAIAEAKGGDVVKLLLPTAEDAVLPNDVTLNRNGQEYTGTLTAEDGSFVKDNGDGTFTAMTAVVQIGEEKYETLAAAVAAVRNDETIKVLKSGNVVTGYARQIGDAGYGEDAGENRLVISTDAKFTLDLNGKTLCGRLNLAKGDMTVANGTILSASQAITLYGSQDYETREAVHAALTFAADATIRSDFAGLCFFTGPTNDTYNPIGFGVRAKVYGKVYGTNPIYVSGNCGRIADSGGYGIEDLVERSGMSFFDLLDLYGVIIDIEDGAVLDASGTVEGDSTQGITLSGYVTVNVKGGTISGSEAIGMKGGRLNVTGGKLIGLGPKVDPIIAVDSGSETSGAGISASTYYNENYPIHINVTGGRIESKNNSALLVAHSRKESGAVKVTNGITASVSGGTFMGGKDQSAILVEPILEGEGGKYPANFISAKLDEEGKETGYPLCNSPIAAAYIAPGYVEKDNKDGTWTVTAGSVEIKTDTENAEVEATIAEGKEDQITQEQADAAAKEVKESIAEAMKDPEVAEVSGTGIKEAAYKEETDPATGEQVQVLREEVVDSLQKQAVEDFKAANPGAGDDVVQAYKDAVNQAITKTSKAETTVEVKLNEVKVSVDLSQAEGHALETTLTSAKFDVKPIFKTTTTIGGKTTITETTLPAGTVLASPITFPLWLNSDFLGQVVKVTHKHEGVADEFTTEVVKLSEGGRKYVEQTWSKFSIALVEAMDITGKACWVNGEVYETVAAALGVAGLPDDAKIFLLADCGETGLALGVNRKIILNDHAFTGSVAAGEGNEMVRGADGTIYVAPVGVNVPVGDNKYVKVRGYTAFPVDVTTPEAKGEYLAAKPEGASLARWQTFVMGVPETTKLVPQIVGAATEGISTVVIKADFPVLDSPAKCGVKTVFRLMQAIGSQTGYSQYGADSDVPQFQVDVKEIAEKTFWKIQTSFKSTELVDDEVED